MKTAPLAILLFIAFSFFAVAEEPAKYFVKKDVKAFLKEGNEYYKTFHRGQPIKCTMEGGSCCFETEPGTVCIDASYLSHKKSASDDIFIKKIYSVAGDSDKSACSLKKDNINPDAFTWSYGVEVDGARGDIVLVGSFFIEKNGTLIRSPALQKARVIKNIKSGDCIEFNITRSDIEGFLSEYRWIAPILKVERDLNIPVKGFFQVFSSVYEDNLANNEVSVGALFPADSADNWPKE